MEEQDSKQANTESDSCDMSDVENREDGTLDADYDGGDMHANTSSPAADTTEIPHNPRPLCNTIHPDHKFVWNRNPTYFSATESASPRNEQNPNPMYKSISTDEEPRSLDDDISSGMTPVSVGPKAAGGEDDGCSIQPQVVEHDEDDKTVISPTHSDTQHQEDGLPACRPTAYSDGDACSIQPYGGIGSDDCGQSYNLRYRGNGNEDCIQSYAVRYKGSEDDSIQPYAVRYKGTDDDDCSQPRCIAQLGGDGSNGDNMSPNSGAAAWNGQTVDTVTNADVDIQPYAVAYMEQSDTGHTAAMQPNEETPTAPSSGDDIPAPRRTDSGNSAARDAGNPPVMVHDNPMYGQNQEYGCLTITVFLVLFIAGWACVGVYFSTGFNRNKKPQSGTDTTHIIGHQAVNTTINTGQPAFDTTYTPVPSALYATYTVSPGQSAGNATYTTGEVQMSSTESPKGGNGGPQTTVFGGEGSERGKFRDSLGVVVSTDDEIFVADRKNQRIQVFNMSGAFLRVFPVFVSPFGGKGMFPCDVTIAQNGRLRVLGTDRLANPGSAYVAEYNQQGVPATSLPRRPPYATLQSRCSAIAVHRRKGVVLAGQTAIIQLLPDGKKKVELADSQVASDLAGDILVTGTELSVVRVGRHLFKFGKPLGAPRGDCTVVSGRRGRIIVADAEGGRLDMFSTRGKFLRTIGNIDYPWGVALGPQGQLVVTNPSNNTVTIFHV